MAKDNPDYDLKQHLAADLIRAKINSLYQEPSPKEELKDARAAGPQRSKHQQFMYDLSKSGRSLAEIQTAWHNYYIDLPDSEKHAVWREFYALHGQRLGASKGVADRPATATSVVRSSAQQIIKQAPKTIAEIKKQILKTVVGHKQLKARHHFKSLVFGVSLGLGAVLILLFGFFNERFIAPFISPSRNVSSTPVIIDPTATDAAGAVPNIIIPKINVEVPVVYDAPSIDEKSIQAALERGVVHYGISPKPGERGNSVIVGHSSNNILNSGRYKFAFVLLNRLDAGDTFVLIFESKRYVYKVYEKKIVSPIDFSVLGDRDKPATVTLITCDPPGTSINRLVVVGEQLVPDPSTNVASTAKPADVQTKLIPGNAPSLWQRVKDWLFG